MNPMKDWRTGEPSPDGMAFVECKKCGDINCITLFQPLRMTECPTCDTPSLKPCSPVAYAKHIESKRKPKA